MGIIRVMQNTGDILITENNGEPDLFPEMLHTDGSTWSFGVGDPEIYKNLDILAVPGGKALDVGMGMARTSLCLAMYGMSLTGYDTDEERLSYVNQWKERGLDIEGINQDLFEADLGERIYDTTVFSQTFVHFPSTESAYQILEKGIKATKVGGHIYFRSGGIWDYVREDYLDALKNHPEHTEVTRSKEDPNVFHNWCGCSGDYKYDPHLFLDPIQLMAFFELNGIKIVHSQIAPQKGRVNVMYGEDWHAPIAYYDESGMITLIGRRVK